MKGKRIIMLFQKHEYNYIRAYSIIRAIKPKARATSVQEIG